MAEDQPMLDQQSAEQEQEAPAPKKPPMTMEQYVFYYIWS